MRRVEDGYKACSAHGAEVPDNVVKSAAAIPGTGPDGQHAQVGSGRELTNLPDSQQPTGSVEGCNKLVR
jgi:hypothetical protein